MSPHTSAKIDFAVRILVVTLDDSLLLTGDVLKVST